MSEAGIRLEKLLFTLKTNQLRLAAETGLNQSFLSAIIRGKKDISRDVLENLAIRYPSVNLTWLLIGTGEMFLPEPISGKKESTAESSKLQEKYKINVPQNSLAHEGELRKMLAENLKTLATRWMMKKNELFGVLMPGIKKPTVTNYFNGSSQPPLGALIRLEELTGIGLSAWVTREIREAELPFEPLSNERQSKEVQLENVRESLRAMLAKMGG